MKEYTGVENLDRTEPRKRPCVLTLTASFQLKCGNQNTLSGYGFSFGLSDVRAVCVYVLWAYYSP